MYAPRHEGALPERGEVPDTLGLFLRDAHAAEPLTKEREHLLLGIYAEGRKVATETGIPLRITLLPEAERDGKDDDAATTVFISSQARPFRAPTADDYLLVQAAERAKDEILAHIAPYVVSLARRYLGRGLPLEDLVQEGMIGAMRAVEKHNANRGATFTTYATWDIRQAMVRAIIKLGRTVRLPQYLNEVAIRTNRFQGQFEAEHGRAPTPNECAEHLGIEEETVRLVFRSTQPTKSLNEKVQHGESTDEFGDLIEDTRNPTPEKIIEGRGVQWDIIKAFSSLSKVEQRVIALRYGLHDGVQRTLEEVGREMGVSRERIRQIELKARQVLQGDEALQSYREGREIVRRRNDIVGSTIVGISTKKAS